MQTKAGEPQTAHRFRESTGGVRAIHHSLKGIRDTLLHRDTSQLVYDLHTSKRPAEHAFDQLLKVSRVGLFSLLVLRQWGSIFVPPTKRKNELHQRLKMVMIGTHLVDFTSPTGALQPHL